MDEERTGDLQQPTLAITGVAAATWDATVADEALVAVATAIPDPSPGAEGTALPVPTVAADTDLPVPMAAAAPPPGASPRRRPARRRTVEPSGPPAPPVLEAAVVSPPDVPAPAAMPSYGGTEPAAPSVGVCPFLGLHEDRATHYAYPDPRNHCHSPAARSLLRRGGRGQSIDRGVQASLCLTSAHETCARYPRAARSSRG